MTSKEQTPTIVENYLQSLDEHDRCHVWLNHLQYPKTQSLPNENSALTTSYSCDENKCLFDEAKRAVSTDVNFKSFSSTKVALEFIRAIEENPKEFVPNAVDGFQLHRGGFNILRLRRRGSKDQGRSGFIEYNDIRADALDHFKHRRQ